MGVERKGKEGAGEHTVSSLQHSCVLLKAALREECCCPSLSTASSKAGHVWIKWTEAEFISVTLVCHLRWEEILR